AQRRAAFVHTRTGGRAAGQRHRALERGDRARGHPPAMNLTLQDIGLGIVGYGEVGRIFAAGLRGSGVRDIAAWDLAFVDPARRDQALAHAQASGVRACDGTAALCEGRQLIISAVTASNTLAVAEAAAQHIAPGAVFLDLNSASPGTKQRAAALIDGAGGHYVEAGVMTSVPPYGIRVPMLLGGKHAARLQPALAAWGMDATVASE